MSFRIKISIVILLSMFISVAIAGPIAVDKLFVSPAHTIVDMSPDGKYLLDYGRRENKKYVEIIDLDELKVVYRSPVDSSVQMKEFGWLGNDYVFMRFYINERQYSKIGKFNGKDIDFKALPSTQKLMGVIDEASGQLLIANTRSDGNAYQLVQGSASAIYDQDLQRMQMVKQKMGNYDRYFYDRFSNRILAVDYDSDKSEMAIASAPLNNQKWESVGSVNYGEDSFSLVGFLSKNTLAVLSNKGTDTVVLREYDLQTQEYGKILFNHPTFDLTDARIGRNGSVEFVAYEQHGVAIRDYLKDNQDELTKRFYKTFKGQEVYIADKSQAEDRVVLYLSGSDQPGKYFLFSSADDKVDPLFPDFPQLQDQKLMPTHRQEAVSVDGLKIEGFVTTPAKGVKNLNTLLVIPHGGPIGVKDSARFNPESQYFASRGFTVLRVNFRGSFGFGKDFQAKGVGEFGRLIEADISAVVDKVRSQYKFDNTCALGASYGAYSSVMLAIQHPTLYKCVVGAFGVYDLPLLFNDSNFRVENSKSIENIVGSYDDSLKDVSPINLIDKLHAPVLLIAGYDDKIARFEHTNRFKYLLNKAKKTFQTLFYYDTRHGHDSWEGDRLDAASSYFFILNSLGLNVPEMEALNSAERAAIATDFIVVADGFNFNKKVVRDADKAFENYLKAAEYGDGRAQYNVAYFYQTGKSIGRSLLEASQWYKKSSDSGYANATYELARLYEKAVVGEGGIESSIDLYRKASQQGHHLADLQIAKYLCLTMTADRNIDECIKLIGDKGLLLDGLKVKAINELRQKVVGEVLHLNNFSISESKKFTEFLKNFYSLNAVDISCNLVYSGYYGQYSDVKYVNGVRVLNGQTSYIPAEKNNKLSATYKCAAAGEEEGGRTAVKVKWITPKIVDDNGVPTDPELFVFFFELDSAFSWTYVLQYESEQVAADWILEIESVDGTLLHRQVFNTVLSAVDEVSPSSSAFE